MKNVVSDSELRKDVFAWYGAAAYAAQCFEVELVTLLLGIYRLNHPNGSLEGLDKVDVELSKKNLGQLYVELRKHVEIGDSFGKLLQSYKDRRNYLTHHFFYANGKKLATHRGCNEMIEELQEISDTLQEADAIAQNISKVVRKASGIPEEELQKQARATMDRELKEELDTAT